MINYEMENDLVKLSFEEKLAIVKIEIEKIIAINNLCYDALKYKAGDEFANGYILASLIIDKASWNIRKMFE